jgi:hypothetical protein
VECDGNTNLDEESKVEAFFNFFDQIMGTPSSRLIGLNLHALDLPRFKLIELSERFTEEEVLQVIKSVPLEKAPGPDGFTSHFLQVAWEVIRHNILCEFYALWSLDTRDLHLINGALIILLPKSNDATSVHDYIPISLIQIFGKLLSKVLSKRLSLWIHDLVHPTQSTFIKGCFIQDNFKFVQASAKALHARKRPSMLL